MSLPLPPLPYQIPGARFLASKTRAGLFDEMGVGKTAQAIFALDHLQLMRGVVVCPASVREVWAGEFRKFSGYRRKILKARNIHDLGLWLKGRADVLLVSYELAAKWAVRMEGDLFDFLIFDESHYLKNPDAARTRSMLGTQCDGANGLARWAGRVWFLTGTAMTNDPTDIWPFLRFCGGTPLTRAPFTARYFRSRMRTFSASQEPIEAMIPELRQAIGSCSLRRTQEEAGLQLPPVWLTTITVDGDTEEITALLRDHPGLDAAILDAVEKGGLSFLDAQHVATLRRLVGEAKAPAYAAMLVDELKRGGKDKQVIFGLHTRAGQIVTEALKAEGIDGVTLIGSTSEKDRIEAVQRFQNDPACRWLWGNITAAGTGHTLTAACHIDMFEQAWAPAPNAQALFRVRRIGQARSVTGRFISLANSIDEVVTESVARKTAAIMKIEGTQAA